MPADPLPWIIVVAALALLVGAGLWWTLRQRRPEPAPLPTEWALLPRPVFNSDERQVYWKLRDALPNHVVLSKLPLVRFCQPSDPERVRYWYELLGSAHVGFAVCSRNGRVLAAIDLDTGRPQSRRVQEIKRQVLAACGVRYLNCPIDHLPSIPELQLLVPLPSSATRGVQASVSAPAPAPWPARRSGRASSQALWQDSGFFQDSFFGAEGLRGVSVREGPLDDAPPGGSASPTRH